MTLCSYPKVCLKPTSEEGPERAEAVRSSLWHSESGMGSSKGSGNVDGGWQVQDMGRSLEEDIMPHSAQSL